MNFKVKREEKHFTQQQLADAVGVKRTSVTMWEAGKSLPRADTLIKVSKILSCSVEELLNEENPQIRKEINYET